MRNKTGLLILSVLLLTACASVSSVASGNEETKK